ncbi:MAG: heat shock protein HspQ [Lentisphaeria bacterium]|nr:heat shock protein HspQ [Lentisphaeria bacterium]NQZ68539.1 heat shock protein HspQ [Lentisphaeria bacterium]
MPDSKQLPFMIELLKEDDTDIRKNIVRQLSAFGDNLDNELRNLNEAIPEEKVMEILKLVSDYHLQLGIGATEQLFVPGQIVKHRRYSYRGVIVHVHTKCMAEESWYENNRSKPEKNQPWYYVLVNKTVQVTYAAQCSLWFDSDESSIEHPLIQRFFIDFKDGKYIRNRFPWPE